MQQWLSQLYSMPIGQWHVMDFIGVLILGFIVLWTLSTVSGFVIGMSRGGPGRILGPGAGRPE
jgi:hypothetical protein